MRPEAKPLWAKPSASQFFGEPGEHERSLPRNSAYFRHLMRSLGLFRKMRWLHAMTALLLVLGTSIPGWAHMSCLVGGHDEWRIGQAETDCCTDDACAEEEESNTPAWKAACCDVEQLQTDRNDFLPQNTVQFQVPVADVLTPDQTIVPLVLADAEIVHISSRPPPLSGWSRALSNRTLLL
jgi:hypothetical protein